jgi:hypothetical protein
MKCHQHLSTLGAEEGAGPSDNTVLSGTGGQVGRRLVT